MQLRRPLAALLACTIGAGPAYAGTCTLLVQGGGLMKLSVDGTVLGSEVAGGQPVVLRISSEGQSTLIVDAPVLSQSPSGFNSGLDFEVAYHGSDVLSDIQQDYTGQQTMVDIPNLFDPVDITFENRITTATGMAAGTYQTQTVVTCS